MDLLVQLIQNSQKPNTQNCIEVNLLAIFFPDGRNNNTCFNMGLNTRTEAFVFQAPKLF